jgi:hypothetical protein
MKDFRTLQVWQKSHDLAVRVYKETLTFPKEELYGVTSQLRRAVSFKLLLGQPAKQNISLYFVAI